MMMPNGMGVPMNPNMMQVAGYSNGMPPPPTQTIETKEEKLEKKQIRWQKVNNKNITKSEHLASLIRIKLKCHLNIYVRLCATTGT